MTGSARIRRIHRLADYELAYVISDLRETIDIQEASARQGYSCPKLGEYWDELFACLEERNRRQEGKVQAC